MKKKILAAILATAMVATVLSGCGSEPAPETEAPAAETEEPAAETEEPAEEAEAIDPSSLEPVELTWYLHGSNVTDDAAVLEKVNAYLTEKINATLKPIWGTWGDFDENAVNSLTGGDDVDIYFTCSWSQDEYNKFARDGYWKRLDDPEDNLIEKYGQDVWATLPDVLKQGSTIDGKDGVGVYAINGFKDYATQNCWDVNVPLLEKYGYTLDDVKNAGFYGFGDIFAKVKEGEGKDFYPFLVEGAVLERMVDNAVIIPGDAASNNVLSFYLNPDDVSADSPIGNKIVNKFATDEYKKFVEKMHEYYEAGYVDPAMGTAQQANDKRTECQKAGKYLIGTQSYSLGYEDQASQERGFQVEFVPTTDAFVDTTSSQGAMMAISSVSKNPERAMMFLNLLNTDPELMTLLNYGVEGVHYDLVDGLVKFNDDARATYQPWTNGMGNITILTPTEAQGEGYWENEFLPYYQSAKGIPCLGFTFNAEPVSTELANCANVADQYALALSVGAIDPATELPAFLDKLNEAGMEKVVAEADAQLQAYLSAK